MPEDSPYHVKPCPFCKVSASTTHTYADVGTTQIVCDSCGARGPESSNDLEAIEKWNEGYVEEMVPMSMRVSRPKQARLNIRVNGVAHKVPPTMHVRHLANLAPGMVEVSLENMRVLYALEGEPLGCVDDPSLNAVINFKNNTVFSIFRK